MPRGFAFQPPEQFRDFILVQLQKRNLTATETSEGFDFENDVIKGTLTLKPISVIWKTKPGVEILDVPLAKGKSSASFKNISDALSFITMRLSKKS